MTYEYAVLLFSMSSILLLVAFFKPHYAIPFCKKRWQAMLFWAMAMIVAASIARDLRPEDMHLNPQEKYQADLQKLVVLPQNAPKNILNISPQELKSKLNSLFVELIDLHSLPAFYEKGFNLPQARTFEDEINRLRAFSYENKELVPSLQLVAQRIYQLAIEWRHNGGKETDLTKQLLEEIKEAIK